MGPGLRPPAPRGLSQDGDLGVFTRGPRHCLPARMTVMHHLGFPSHHQGSGLDLLQQSPFPEESRSNRYRTLISPGNK